MRKLGPVLVALALLVLPVVAASEACTTLKEGVLTYSASHYLYPQPLKVGFDAYGYNYQAHLFNGFYANVYLGGEGFPAYEGDTSAYLAALTVSQQTAVVGKWYWPYRDVQLGMKWNDAWISNKDCDADGKLDRHYGYPSYIGSGAWETNHMSAGGGDDQWTYFVKIVAAPADALKIDIDPTGAVFNVWYAADGTEIGPDIWGEFATIQEVASGEGATYVSPAGPGVGKW